MSKTARADYAPTTDWNGIIGKPDSFGVSDIGGLTGIGYADGQIPVYNRAAGRFRPGSRTPASPTPTPTPAPATFIEVWVWWTIPVLHALQTTDEDFDFVGVAVSQPVIFGAPFSTHFIQVSVTTPEANKVRITVTNFNLADVDLGSGMWRLRVFTP